MDCSVRSAWSFETTCQRAGVARVGAPPECEPPPTRGRSQNRAVEPLVVILQQVQPLPERRLPLHRVRGRSRLVCVGRNRGREPCVGRPNG